MQAFWPFRPFPLHLLYHDPPFWGFIAGFACCSVIPKYKIVIVIDDIDRLNCTEIQQIFQLVKSICDLPNIVYLLSFDKDVVINALEAVQNSSGEDYLEKMVQIPFEIPQIDKDKVENLLLTQLDKLIIDVPEDEWDSVYWGNVFNSGIKYFFNNIRDVVRFINTFSFIFNLLSKEANITDLIAITAIQVFKPQIYKNIKENKDLFTKIDYRTEQSDKDKRVKLLNNLLLDLESNEKEFVKKLLSILFPQIRSLINNIGFGTGYQSEWRKNRRICSEDCFDFYFRLALDVNDISKEEMKSALNQIENVDAFKKIIIELNEKNKIEKFLERFEDYTSDILLENIENVLKSLFDTGDYFPEKKGGFIFFDTNIRIMRIVHQLMNRIDDKKERFKILKNSLNYAEHSLYPLVHQISIF